MKKIFKNRIFLTIFLSLSIFLFVYISTSFNFFYSFNDYIKWSILRLKQTIVIDFLKKDVVSDDLVFVTIDEKTFKEFGFPMSRAKYVPIINNLKKAWAEVIGFDVMFANENKNDIEWDDKLAEAIKNAWNIVLWWWVYGWKIETLLSKFQSWALNFGYYTMYISQNLNKVNSFFPNFNLQNLEWKKNYDHFSISLLKAYYSRIYNDKTILDYEKSDKKYFYLRNWWDKKSIIKVPFKKENDKKILINFVIKLKNWNTRFAHYSFLDIYNWNFEPEKIKWKIVIVWATASWLNDTFNTINWVEYWVYVIWNIVNMFLKNGYIQILPTNIELIILFLLIVLSIYFNLSRSGYVLLFSNSSIFFIFILIYPISIFGFTNYILNYIFELILVLIFSLAIWNLAKYLMENKDKIKLNKALSEYVSRAVAKEILYSSWEINLDWEEKKLAIFFSDIEWFTIVSEKFSPKKLVSFLRKYLSEMSDIIMDKWGFINKYEWDAIMWLWGAFKKYDKLWYYACLSAIEQQKKLKNLNKIWIKEGFSEIKSRIWIHIWNAIVWNIGSTWRKMEYTALWDSVNLASRLEWVNKFYGTYICVSEDVYEENKNHFEFRYLDLITVKWKEKAIKIYELLSLKWDFSDKNKQIRNEFERAISFYKDKNFEEAEKIFKLLSDLWDKPSFTYLERIKFYKKNPPSADWGGIWKMLQK